MHQLALHLCQRSHDMEEKPSSCGGGVNAVGDAAKLYALLLKGLDQVHQAFYGPTEPVEFPDHERVNPTLSRRGPLRGPA